MGFKPLKPLRSHARLDLQRILDMEEYRLTSKDADMDLDSCHSAR